MNSLRRCAWFVLTAAFFVALPIGHALGHERPNIVILLADDLGFGDLGCYGDPIVKTPNIDKLAAEGLKFTSFYSGAANCSPARAALMTGRTPYRCGIYSAIATLSPVHLRRQEITVAKLLQQAGYSTAQVGKWHLNGYFNYPVQPQPNDHGFDHWFATQNNALPNHRNPYNFVRNGIPMGPSTGYAGQIVADEAVRWLKELRNPDKPFFLYVAFHEPHEPIATDDQHERPYSFDDPAKVAFYGNITQLDAAVGRVLATLDELKLRDDTLVIFSSDNGPAVTPMHPYGSSGPLREKKGHLYEGGIRVPGLARWPGRVKPGTTTDEPVGFVDVLPTVCRIVGIDVPADRAIDGESFLPVLEGKTWRRTGPLYWQFNSARSEPKVALRDGDWKILAELDQAPTRREIGVGEQAMQILKNARPTKYQLYNLKTDVGETTDLAQREPAKLAEMTDTLNRIFTEVQAEAPVWPAWEDPRYEQLRIKWPEYWLKRREQRQRTRDTTVRSASDGNTPHPEWRSRD